VQNIINTYTLLFAVVSVFVFAIYLVYMIRRKELLNIIPLLASVITVFLIYNVIAVACSVNYYNILTLDICIALLSTILALFYISKPYIFLALLALVVVGVLIYMNSNIGNVLFAGMFAIGTLYGLMYRQFVLSPVREGNGTRKKKDREVTRDIIQIGLGIVLAGVVYYFAYSDALMIVFGLILLGYLGNNILANVRIGPIYKRAMDLERKNVSYGMGASYLAVSAALMLGFTHSAALLLFGIVVVFFADSAATIVGLSMRRASSLPYNKYKTYVGTLAFFLVVAVLGYFIPGIGIYSVPLALVLAFVESLDISVDDNIRSGILVVILGALVGL
jgi:dolichol kinase